MDALVAGGTLLTYKGLTRKFELCRMPGKQRKNRKISMPDPEKTPASFVTFNHKKSGFFRVVHADGAWGGANAAGIVHMTFYSEHAAIPASVTYPIDKAGNMINTPTAAGDEGWQREMEVSVAMTVSAAVQVRATLDAFIKMAVDSAPLSKQQTENITKPE
jgi:hypothetical protein